jgi:hypothetical protein
MSNSPRSVARMKRSAIRGQPRRFNVAPGLRCAPSGLRKKKRSGTPTDATSNDPHQRVRLAPRIDRLAPALRCGRARLSAFHHGLTAANERHRCAPVTRFPGRYWVGAGVTRSRPSYGTAGSPPRPVVVSGRAYCPEPPGSGVTSPARGHRSRPASRPSPVTSLPGVIGGHVTETETIKAVSLFL